MHIQDDRENVYKNKMQVIVILSPIILQRQRSKINLTQHIYLYQLLAHFLLKKTAILVKRKPLLGY